MINWKTVPAVRMLVPLCFGIFSAVILPDYFSFCLIGSIFVLPFLIVLAVKEKINYQFRWWFGILLSIFWFLVGYYSVGNHDDFYQAQFYAKFVSSKEENRLLLQIDDLPVLKNKIKLYAKVLECNGQKARGNLLLYVDTTAQNKQLEYGDIVEVVSQLQAIEGPKNPNAYDFQNVMKLKNVRFSGYSKAENISLLAKNRGNFLMHLAYRAQKKLLEVLSTYIRDPNAFSVGSALILGYRSDISEELTQAYVNTGAMHVLSVSGLHVGLVASLFGWIIGRWRNGKRYWKITEVLLQVLFVWGFALITGASSCVLRAAVMFSFTIISRAFSRDANTYNSLIASAFFLLLYNP
ncbi:MAG: ComEC/Rec2 family competence protein, partial [Saprospiraceae bacterium]